MNLSKKVMYGLVSLVSVIMLSACASDGDVEESTHKEESTPLEETSQHEGMNHSNMEHSGSREVPEGLKVAENPKYKVGSKAIIKEGHMEGMKGAEATIVGAYDTIAYTISYTPTNGGERVENHKWVIHEEILNVGDAPLEPGTEVTINANHMEGMEGATAKIDSVEKTTVYMINFKPTTGGDEVTNHKWVTEEELSPVK
jgi:hypothetical protein